MQPAHRLSAMGSALPEVAGVSHRTVRARAAVQMYRTFQLRELPTILRGRYADTRLTVPTRLLFGIEDLVLRPELLAGYERHADEMTVEEVPDCGHFIADERPELVADRARGFFA
jgi:pimeloyl-ACP methyl ester carboxylesterase